jgi:hypothetical protein
MSWILRRRPSPLTLALLGLIVAAGLATASHPRPKGATHVKVSLVPAYKQCTSSNTTHSPPLAFPSCAPPVQTSDYLTVGTLDANGAAANSTGFVELNVKPGSPGPPEDAAVMAKGSLSDVRCKPATSPDVCNSPNDVAGPDYSGQLLGRAIIRVTDHDNGPSANQAATVQDFPLELNFQCSNTADTTTGGVCIFPVAECLGCPPPKEGKRTIAEIAQIQVYDGGADGNVFTAGDTLFAVSGIFIP